MNSATSPIKTEVHSVMPHMEKLFDVVVPALGHNMPTAFNDLLDNCLDAKATKIKVEILDNKKGEIESYSVIDNGVGMDKKTLIESFRFTTNVGHAQGALGKYGIGGTAACFTLGNKKTTITKMKNGRMLVGEMDTEKAHKGVIVRSPTAEEEEHFLKHNKSKKQGTIIQIARPKPLEIHRSYALRDRLKKEFSSSFYQRLSKKNCSIWVNRPNRPEVNEIHANDPLLGTSTVHGPNAHKIKSTYTKTLKYNGSSIKLRFMEIDRATSEETDRQAMDQGLYFNRNKRLIRKGQSHPKLWRGRHNSLNCGRVEIVFDETLDVPFGLKALKNQITPCAALVEVLNEEIHKFKLQVKKSAQEANPDDPDERLEEEDENFTKQLQSNAADIGLPRIAAIEGDGHRGPRKNSGSEASQPKGASPYTRTSKSRYLMPNWAYVREANNPRPFWHDFEEGEMLITVNRAHNLIKEKYDGAGPEAKLFFKKMMVADCWTAHEMSIYDERVYDTLRDFLDRKAEKLSLLDKHIK